MLVTVESKSYLQVYQSPVLPSASQRSFQPGPGEANPVQSVSLYFDGVIFVEGHLLRSVSVVFCIRIGIEASPSCISVSPRPDYILFSTRNPRAVQRIPWPDADGEDTAGFQSNYDSWSVDEYNFPWLDCTDGAHDRSTVASTLLTREPL